MEEARIKMQFGLISTVNLSEVYQKSLDRGRLPLAIAIMETAGLESVPLTDDVAMIAAELHPIVRGKDISLADRICLALAIARELPVLTGDHKWSTISTGAQVELFRPTFT